MSIRRPVSSLGVAAVLVAAVAVSAPASAQSPPVRYIGSNNGLGGFLDTQGIRLRNAEERGIKAGDFVIWPSLFLEGRYDSNFFQESEVEGVDAVPVFRIMPGVAISNPRPNKLAFTVGAQADARLYASGEELIDERRNVGVYGDLYLGILPNGPVTITILDVFRRTLDPRTAPIDPGDEVFGAEPVLAEQRTYNQNTNQAGVRLSIHPGGGALDITTGYSFIYNKFDDFAEGDYMAHDVLLRGTWRFYPKTLALIEATTRFMDWDTDARLLGQNIDNKSFRVQAGLSGYITKRLATLLKVGYGNSFHDDGPSFNNAIGQAELSYTFSHSILAAAGFLRDYRPSYWGNYLTENRTYVRGQFRFARRVGLDLAAAYHLIDYAEFDPAAVDPEQFFTTFVSHKERREQHVTGHLRVDVDITRWIGLSVGYEVRAVFSNFEVVNTDPETLVRTVDPAEYVRHQVYGSVNVRY